MVIPTSLIRPFENHLNGFSGQIKGVIRGIRTESQLKTIILTKKALYGLLQRWDKKAMCETPSGGRWL